MDALIAGVIAGLAIAMPVGPIALLILDTGMRRGFRVASAAGAGTASADGVYATLAGLLGAGIATVLASVILPARLLGATVLAFIGLRSLLALRHPADPNAAPSNGGRGPGRTYLFFLLLTIVNPTTFLYFSALMLGLPVLGPGTGSRLLFAAGAFGASLAWQQLLAVAGALLRGRLSPRVQLGTRLFGALVILGFAVRIGLQAVNGA